MPTTAGGTPSSSTMMANRFPNMATSGFQIEIESVTRNPKSQIRNPCRVRPYMLPIAVVREIDSMVHEGTLSHRKIALRLGVSRGVVSAIANGRRGLYGQDPFAKYSPLAPTSPPTRCSICGYRVYLPCLVCRAREHHQRQTILRILVRARRRGNPVHRRNAG
jgi:hypothetical protein